jgi:acyl-CoA oxidase
VPQALNLIESFEFDDNSLCSAIGSYDGQDIQRLYDAASANPLNDKDVLDGFKTYIKPIMNEASEARAKM